MVHWTSSSITRNANSQAHLKPTEIELWRWVHQSVLQPASCDSDDGRKLRATMLLWMQSGKHYSALLADDFSLPVTLWHQPLFTLCVILVFMDTHFSCQMSLNKNSSEDTVIYFKARKNLAELTLLRPSLSISNGTTEACSTSPHHSTSLFWLLIKTDCLGIAAHTSPLPRDSFHVPQTCHIQWKLQLDNLQHRRFLKGINILFLFFWVL